MTHAWNHACILTAVQSATSRVAIMHATISLPANNACQARIHPLDRWGALNAVLGTTADQWQLLRAPVAQTTAILKPAAVYVRAILDMLVMGTFLATRLVRDAQEAYVLAKMDGTGKWCTVTIQITVCAWNVKRARFLKETPQQLASDVHLARSQQRTEAQSA